jgi:AraC family transcriptional regulator
MATGRSDSAIRRWRMRGAGRFLCQALLPTDSFARRFRATTGHPPYRYVLRRRVERAAALLRATDTSISEVALATGFSSQSHFTSAFKQPIGTTPSAYRRRYRPGF